MLGARFGYTVIPRRFGLPTAKTLSQVRAAHRFSSLLAFLLTATSTFAVGGMLVWHTYLVLTAQGTVDFHKNRAAAADAARGGYAWKNIHDLGCAKNWQERFDARGQFWMLTWMLPRLSRHRGCGYELPLAAGAQSYLDGQAIV